MQIQCKLWGAEQVLSELCCCWCEHHHVRKPIPQSHGNGKVFYWSMWMLTTYAENVSLGFLLPDVYSLGWLSFRVLTLRLANPPPCAEHISCWVSRLHSRCLRQNKYSPPNPSFSAYMPVSSSFPSHPRHVCRTSHWTWQAIPCLIWLIPSQTSLKRTEII